MEIDLQTHNNQLLPASNVSVKYSTHMAPHAELSDNRKRSTVYFQLERPLAIFPRNSFNYNFVLKLRKCYVY